MMQADGGDMGTFPRLAAVAAAHMTLVVAAYATGLFGLHLPHKATIILWLAAPSLLALPAYAWILIRSPLLASEPARAVKLGFCAFTATLVSLYLGIFIAYNTFGS
jgi:hypothetical protein